MLVLPQTNLASAPVSQNDFKKVAGLIYRSIEFEIDSNDPWNSIIGISPQDFLDVLTKGLPGKPNISVISNDKGQISIEIKEKNNKYFDSRSIQGSEIQAGAMLVDLKGQGIGKQIFKNYVELGVHLQFYGFIVHAGDDNGAYAWAKAGVPLQEEGILNHNALRGQLRKRLEAVKQYVRYDDYKEALSLIELKNIYDINAIADLGFVLPDEFYFDKISELNFGRDGDDEPKRLRDLFEFCADNKKDVTLGRYLLSGANYRGYLSFFDHIAMPRIEKYVGGFDTIKLVGDNQNKCSKKVTRSLVA